MPTGNPNGMTAKKALSTLRGSRTLLQAQLITDRRHGEFDGEETLTKQIDALSYAIAAVRTFKASGKSALKAASALNS